MTGTAARPAAERESVHDVKTIRDVRIPSCEEDITLSADLYRPVDVVPVPALVTVLPYRKDGHHGIAIERVMRWFAERGYAVVMVDFRGTGSSDGIHRPPFDPAEADDGVAAVEWAAAQPWCTGHVGMMGMSYGGIMSMRTAGRRPSGLKAIVPVMAALDVERDMVHPAGQRGLFGTAAWGNLTLLNQLMPPLENYTDSQQQNRWRNRLHRSEPWIVDLVRHGPGHRVWRDRAIDVAAIDVPAFFVAGWRDVFCEPTIRAYENANVPKKLLVGPWGHIFPGEALPFIINWWDLWLKEIDDAFMKESEVILQEQAKLPRWRQFRSWPPADDQLRFTARSNLTLGSAMNESAAEWTVIGEYVSDPTVGALSGEGTALLDQRDDDARTLALTSDRFKEDVVLIGRPIVVVRTAAGTTVQRLVARLCAIDSTGRSTLITKGTAATRESCSRYEVRMEPTCFRVQAGCRLRVTLGDADFPRLWPTVDDDGRVAVLKLAELEFSVDTISETAGHLIDVPKPQLSTTDLDNLTERLEPEATVIRDLIANRVTLGAAGEHVYFTRNKEHRIEKVDDITMTVAQRQPHTAIVNVSTIISAKMGSGETVVTQAQLRMDPESVSVHGQVEIDGESIFAREWST